MSIKPVDIQTLFMRLNEIGKEQSHQKEASALQQAHEGKRLVDRELEEDRAVNETKAGQEESKVREHSEDEEKREKNEGKKREQDEEKEKSKKYFKDPDLGGKIDIEG